MKAFRSRGVVLFANSKTITAAVKRVEGENVVFEMGGKEVPYALANLSEQSRQAIVALAKVE